MASTDIGIDLGTAKHTGLCKRKGRCDQGAVGQWTFDRDANKIKAIGEEDADDAGQDAGKYCGDPPLEKRRDFRLHE